MITVTDNKDELRFDGWEFTNLPGDCVLIILDDADRTGWVKRKSGIHIPAHQDNENQAEKFRVGRVLAVGDTCPDWIKNAKHVLFSSDQLVAFKTRGFNKGDKKVMLMGQGLFMGAVEAYEDTTSEETN
jgi:co-chaperonin GroES (HSP10)